MKKSLFFKSLLALCAVAVIAGCVRKNFSIEIGAPAKETLQAQNPNGFNFASYLNSQMTNAPGGINLGGVFEGSIYNNYDTSFAAVKRQIDSITAKQFSYVRFQINWERADRRDGDSIKSSFMNQIKTAVDYALTNNLYVIINMQNHALLMNNPDAYKNMFLSQWRQIATAFEAYPDKLMFELLNEPTGNMTAGKWNDFYKDALNEIRATPAPTSNNKYRTVLVGTSHLGALDYLKELDKAVLKADKNTILTIHYYNPMTFTHQNSWITGSAAWKGTRWDNTAAERNYVNGSFAYPAKLAADSGIAVNIGEYGSYSEADMDSRVRYTDYLMKYFRSLGFSSGFFNYLLNPGFGIYDVNNGPVLPLAAVFKAPNSSGLIGSSDTPDKDSALYTSNVTSADRQGWQFYSNDNGKSRGSWVVNANQMTATIDSAGSDIYGMILIKTPATGAKYSFQKNARYYINFKASSSNPFQRIYVTTNTDGEGALFYPDATLKQYSYVFRALKDEPSGYLKFYLGADPSSVGLPYTITISEVEVHKFDFSARPYPQF